MYILVYIEADDARQNLRAAVESREVSERAFVLAIHDAKAAGVPVREIAELAGFKTRRSVYEALKRK